MPIPNAERAIIAPEKLRDYLLSPDHLPGPLRGAEEAIRAATVRERCRPARSRARL